MAGYGSRIDQFLLLPRVMYGYLEIIILLQGRLAIDHRILKIHFLVNRCGVIIPFTNQGIIVKGSYYLPLRSLSLVERFVA